jgi:TPR repeat protein
MNDLTPIQLLLIVNAYLFLGLVLFGLSAKALVCRLKKGTRCSQRHRAIISITSVPLMLSCLALLAMGLFAIGMSHGSRPEGYQVVLFILGCLLPIVLLIFWIRGSLWVDALWVALIAGILSYLMFINPAVYVQYWADSNVQWGQMWMARHYETGQGGLTQSDSTARSWYKQAALNGNSDAQYKMASTARRNKEAIKWYLLAAEQGHVDAMVQLARLGRSDDDRQHWLDRAVDHHHPEALFMLAKKTMASDLALARELLLDAAENGSRTAIVFLTTQYLQGGVLFEQDDESAIHWLLVLEKSPVSTTEPVHLTPESIDLTLTQARAMGLKIRTGDSVTLYRRAQKFLHHPAKDQILHDRAIDYLSRAANNGHGESALELSRLAMQNDQSAQLNAEALKWYQLAAKNDNLHALKKLARYYKEEKNEPVAMLQKSLEYNERLLRLLQIGNNNTKQRLTQEYWSSEYRDTQKRLAQLTRLGGSWQAAIAQAGEDSQKEYLLAKELLKDGQHAEGMKHLKSAAQRDNHQARFELALRTLRGPRSFTEEVAAISELQALDKLGMLAASIELGSLYQSGTGVVPRNYYLARQLFRKDQVDSQLSEKALRWLTRVPDFTDSLQLQSTDDVSGQIEAWYQQMLSQKLDKAILQQQYDILLDHFRDIDDVKRKAAEDDAIAQYQLAQTLQSHNLSQAMEWLKRAATNGHSNAQYELAVRMIRGKKNTPEQQQELKRWAITAANSGHVGALVFLAAQHKNGNGGFEKNTLLARDYYQKSLHSSDASVLFSGKVAGREIIIKRSNIQNALATLKE